MPGDHGVQHRNLGDTVEVGRTMEHQFNAQGVCGGLSTLVHGDIECVGSQALHQRDSLFLVLGHRCRGQSEGQRQSRSSAHKIATFHPLFLPEFPFFATLAGHRGRCFAECECFQ